MTKRSNLKLRAENIWSFTKPYKWSFINACFCICITSIISMVYPCIFGLLIDEVFYNKNIEFFIIIIFMYLFIYGGGQLLHLILNILWPYQYTEYLLDIRLLLYRKILSLPYDVLSKKENGYLVSMINWEAEGFVELIHRNLSYLISNTLRIIMIIILVNMINSKLSLLMLFIVPTSYLVTYIFGIKIEEKQVFIRNIYMGFLSWVYEMLGGINDIKFLSAERCINEKFFEQINNINKQDIQLEKSTVISERICELMSMVGRIALFFLSSRLIFAGSLTLGDFVAVVTYYEMSRSILEDVNYYWNEIQKNFAVIDDTLEILESKEVKQGGLPVLYIEKGDICFEDIECYYDKESKVLENLYLCIKSGEKVAIVGESGSGKSTIVNLLIGFIHPQKGRVLIDGKNITEYNLKSLREQIGIIQQETFIFDGTIKSNLLLANQNATDLEMIDALYDASLGSYYESLKDGLNTILGVDGINMSEGEKQRLSIARMFLRNPKILIFDEATSAVDARSEAKINNALQKITDGRTCIIISHRLSTILTADKIAILNEGLIQEIGNNQTLLRSSDKYKQLFAEQYLVSSNASAK